jgi:putative ABC transport system substrate-binding protein
MEGCTSLIERGRFLVVSSAFLALIAASGLHAVHAQQASHELRRIGYLSQFGDFSKPKKPSAGRQAFLNGLAEAGFVDGNNLIIEYRSAHGKAERFPDLARELIAREVEVIFSWSTGAGAAAEATKTVPVVFILVTDPVANGLVQSLAHPGGNVTGISNQGLEINTKRLELLKSAIPSLQRVAVLIHRKHSLREQMVHDLAAAAPLLGVKVDFFKVQAADELPGAFAAMRAAGADALLIQGFDEFFLQRKQISQLALDSRLPAMCFLPDFVQAGCLMSYGQNLLEIFRRGGHYVAKILKGANPADLPVEQPTKFDFVINAKTAKALGVVFPRSVLLRADRVIE